MHGRPDSTSPEAEFVAWAEEIRRGADGEMPFVWAIMRSPWVSLHWSLIHDDAMDAGFRRSLRARFGEHGEAGRDFLLRTAAEEDASGDAILIAAKMCDPLLNGIPGRAEVREMALRFIDAAPRARSSSLLALGWVGDAADIDLLQSRVRGDDHAECRVSAAGALAQLLIRHPGDETQTAVEQTLRAVLEQDPSPLVRDAAMEALQVLPMSGS